MSYTFSASVATLRALYYANQLHDIILQQMYITHVVGMTLTHLLHVDSCVALSGYKKAVCLLIPSSLHRPCVLGPIQMSNW